MEKSLFNELTLEQKQKLLTLPAELKHFTQTQWAAIYGIVPMTQFIFILLFFSVACFVEMSYFVPFF